MLPSAMRAMASASTGIGTSKIERLPVSRAMLLALRSASDSKLGRPTQRRDCLGGLIHEYSQVA